MLTVLPAYGRDYNTEEKVKKAWADGKDFQINDVSSKYNGAYINLSDAVNFGVNQIKIRYNKKADYVVVNV